MTGTTGAGTSGTPPEGARGSGSGRRRRAPDSQGGTVTDTRGPQAQQYGGGPDPYGSGPAGPQPQGQTGQPGAAAGGRHGGSGGHAATSTQSAGAAPYQPPQAYQPPTGGQGPVGGLGGTTSGGGSTGRGVRKPRTGARPVPRTRKARLRVAKADPWSVMKVSFLLSIALGICTIVAAAVLWMVMDAMGVFSTVGDTVSEATSSSDGGGFDLESFLSLPRVLMFTSVIAIIDVVLMTALATLGAFIYNLSAGFVGGIELTLAEDE
ncbi:MULTISPECIES: DUF3566 domain-containing protein [unclassified Streptomyces]|uniref:DUF3566 domain-containing protein n=1 Tax=unclassified Streptomyces TaxID=2593676 RepID=UPI0013E971CB|nr:MULTISPECIES: DUF3566 domain-containing protein [unclassified Streptomyces]WEH28637.1 DUF3566 domain-containing protein [Streptomyces sp. AM 3-1-1]